MRRRYEILARRLCGDAGNVPSRLRSREMDGRMNKTLCVPRLITVRWKETRSSKSPTRIFVSFLSVDFDEDDIVALSSYDEKSVVAAVKSQREREVNRTVEMKDIEVEMRY